MSSNSYVQRQETFSDIFGGSRSESFSNDGRNNVSHHNDNPSSNPSQHASLDPYNPGVQYENVPQQLLGNVSMPANVTGGPKGQLPYPATSPNTHTNFFEGDDKVAPLNVGISSKRYVSAGSIQNKVYPDYSNQPRTKSLSSTSSLRGPDNSWGSRNMSTGGRNIPSKMDLWQHQQQLQQQQNLQHQQVPVQQMSQMQLQQQGFPGQYNGQVPVPVPAGTNNSNSFNFTNQNDHRSKSLTGMQWPTRSASTVSSRGKSGTNGPSRSQTSISSTKMMFGQPKRPAIYPAMLSKVSREFRELLSLGEKDKNGLTYRDAFTGQEAINVICMIIRNNDRGLALLLGRALDAQKFFHDVTYEHRLRDSKQEVYQFNEVLEGLESSRQNSFSSMSQATLVGHNGLDFEEVPTGPGVVGGQVPSATGNAAATQPVRVNGVFTLLTECYSPTCSRDRLCYSIACPRRFEQQARLNMKPQGGLKRIESKASVHADESQKLLWSLSVPKTVLESVDEKEVKRQEVIFETIYTERDFVKDLEYIKDFWIIPLRTRNIIPERERESFIRKVFGNVNEILMINSKMAEELTNRQKQQHVVYQIGDIFINFIPRFHPFVKYAANRIFGKYEYERQKQTNPLFAKFVQETERLKESRKLDLSSFLSKPVSRPARYPLLLQQVLKRTKDDNPDKKNIKKAIEMLEKLLAKINKETGYASDKYQLAILKQQLVFKPGEFVDLKLTDDQRRILYNGHLTRRNNDSVQVYLLDNTLLFVKIKQVNKREQHKVFQRPIPIQLLHVSLTEEPLSLRDIIQREGPNSIKKIVGISNNNNNGFNGQLRKTGTNGSTLGNVDENAEMSRGSSNGLNSSDGSSNNLSGDGNSSSNNNASNDTFTFVSGSDNADNSHNKNHSFSGSINESGNNSSLTFGESNRTTSSTSIIGGRSNTLKLDLTNNSQIEHPMSFVYIGRRGYDMTLYAQSAQIQRQLYEQIEQQQTKLKKLNDIFTLVPLTDRFFNHQTNQINCAIPFYGGRRLVCGTDSGIFVSTIRLCVGDNGESRVVSHPINVINKPNVTQIEVLDDYQTLLAICDKKLYCWPLDVLESFNVKENSKKGKELLNHVSFFKVGVFAGKRLVCAAKNGSSHSIKIFEPSDPRTKIVKKKFKTESQEIPFNSEIVSISFLKSLCIVGCTRGFQVVSLVGQLNIQYNNGSSSGNSSIDKKEFPKMVQQLLDPADTSLDFVTRREGLKPIAIYKLNSDYLLSYSEFSFFINVNGWRARPTWIIHWEGLPQSFALWYPYLLSFDNNFIEIRDCNTSELLRVITGEGIRLLYASSQEILYAYVDERGYDVVASLDFWGKANKAPYLSRKNTEF